MGWTFANIGRTTICGAMKGNTGGDMKIFFGAFLGLISLCALLNTVGFGWFYFYSADIPNISRVDAFASATATTASDGCQALTISVIPEGAMGKNIRDATRAVEGSDRVLAMQIARGLFCNYQGRMLWRDVLEYKASIQLRHKFTPEELLTIYLNKGYFGDGLVGVDAASRHFYGKRPLELDLSQGAMVAGLLKAPRQYSPEFHPDKARTRRDAVIASMLNQEMITTVQAQAAMQSDIK